MIRQDNSFLRNSRKLIAECQDHNQAFASRTASRDAIDRSKKTLAETDRRLHPQLYRETERKTQWFCKEYEIEVTASFDSPAKASFTPVVNIVCKDARDAPHWLTTDQFFASEIDAQLCGGTMATEWIDEQSKSDA